MIDEKRVREGEALLEKYRQGKALLDQRIVENEEWYRLRHWEQLRQGEERTASAWLFHSLVNKHADLMDNFPQPNLLPREARDREDAAALSRIVPVVLEQNDFEDTYDSVGMDKLKHGTGVYKVFWDKDKLGGLGDIGIRQAELVNLYWEPGVSDLQQSANLFHVELMDRAALKAQYPKLTFHGGEGRMTRYRHSSHIDTSDKCMVVDWYYKKWQGGREVLHYIKFCEGQLLYATENTKGMENGLYDHGMYPYVFDVLFAEKDSPAGFGYVDIMKDAQISIDNIWHSFEENVVWNAKPRYFCKDGAGINREQFADVRNTIVDYTGNGESIIPLQGIPVGGNAISLYQLKIEELKETSNNRDFAQGGTAHGVTAASAIAALQEAGSKTSRDMIKASYRSFTRIIRMVVELIRQFYDQPREFRILGETGEDFIRYDNHALKGGGSMVMGIEMGGRKPIFDIRITSQKASPFSKVAQNELAKELYSMGFFNPALSQQALAALEMMDFEGKDLIRQRVAENADAAQKVAKAAEKAKADEAAKEAEAEATETKGTKANPLKAAYQSSKANSVDQARQRAQAAASVK